MKNACIVSSLFILFCCSCINRKNSDPEPGFGTGCVTRVYPSAKNTLTAANQARVDSFFRVNNMVFPKYLIPYSVYQSSKVVNGSRVPYAFDVFNNQFANNQPLFLNNLTYEFVNGSFSRTFGYDYGGAIQLDTIPQLSPERLRIIALQKIFSESNPPDLGLRDSCIRVQFGYYPVFNGNSQAKPDVVKAWHIYFKNNPTEIYINDNDGVILSYSTGVFAL